MTRDLDHIPTPSARRRWWRWLPVCVVLAVMSFPLQAELVIQVTEGADRGIPIAVVPFSEQGDAPGESLDGIIRNNLTLTGDFQMLAPSRMLSLPAFGDDVHFRDWRMLGQQYVLLGTVTHDEEENRHRLEYELYDVARQERVMRSRASAPPEQLRRLAHHVSNRVYEAITGLEGVFHTRMAFVTRTGSGDERRYHLKISDYDGHREQTLFRSDEPIMSPDWSPDGEQLVYVSFETGRPAIFRQELATGEREQLTDFRGLNSAPRWSPDGESIVLTLSKDGSAEIYRLTLESGHLERLTRHWSINTEGTWSPDGNRIAFTSDRSGQPQIYILNRSSGEAERATFDGRYNARARFSPDGDKLYFVHGRDGEFYIGALDLDSGDQRIVTQTPTDDAPAVSPNGRLLLYVTRDSDGKRHLEVASTDGRSQVRLPISHEGIRNPAWEPIP